MNAFDIMFMKAKGIIKPDADLIDILWFLKAFSEDIKNLYPSDALLPGNDLYPVEPS